MNTVILAFIFILVIGAIVAVAAILLARDWRFLARDRRALRQPRDTAAIGFEVNVTEQSPKEQI